MLTESISHFLVVIDRGQRGLIPEPDWPVQRPQQTGIISSWLKHLGSVVKATISESEFFFNFKIYNHWSKSTLKYYKMQVSHFGIGVFFLMSPTLFFSPFWWLMNSSFLNIIYLLEYERWNNILIHSTIKNGDLIRWFFSLLPGCCTKLVRLVVED